jgi:serine protease Do
MNNENGSGVAKQVSLGGTQGDSKMKSAPGPAEKALGMEFSGLNDELRQRYAIKSTVASGVVITSVDPDSSAAEKDVQPGDVLVQINQEPVKEPADIAKKLHALKSSGKKSALLLVANGQGEVRLVRLGLP